MKQDLKSMTLAEMQEAFAALGEPKFRAKQVFTWLHRGATCFDEMTNLSKPLREKLDGLYFITAPRVARKQVSKLDGTIKYLWQLGDGNCVESVVMQYHHGNTVCISSEVGCPMGCKFCASTLGGLVRRLTPAELLDQVLFSQLDSGLTISNIVLMGIGEPLDNFDAVMRFLELVNSPEGLNIGMRHISLSTCGLVDKIELLAERNLQLTLSVSLHSPDNESRNKIMPVNKGWPVEHRVEVIADDVRLRRAALLPPETLDLAQQLFLRRLRKPQRTDALGVILVVAVVLAKLFADGVNLLTQVIIALVFVDIFLYFFGNFTLELQNVQLLRQQLNCQLQSLNRVQLLQNALLLVVRERRVLADHIGKLARLVRA